MPAKLRAHWRTASRGAAGWRCGVSRSRLRKCGSHRIKSSFQRWASEGWGITSENAAESGGCRAGHTASKGTPRPIGLSGP
jgi:hypothetical protein